MNTKVDIEYFDNADWWPFSPDATQSEYAIVWDKLRLLLADDFSFELSSRSLAGTSRSITIEVLSAKCWNASLVEQLRSFLIEKAPNYCLILTEDLSDRLLNGSFIKVSSLGASYWFKNEDESNAFWNQCRFDEPEGVGKRWTTTGYIDP